MIRHLKFPKTLYRLQNSLRFRMKQGTQALQQGRINYDYIINDHGLYLPRTSIKTDKIDFRPNGVQLYCMSDSFKEMLKGTLKQGTPRYYYVVEIPEGTELPQSMVLLQDPVESFVYWLETNVPTEPKEFNSKIELLLLRSKIHRKKEFKQMISNSQTKLEDINSNSSTTIV